jgi:hypothetical protein
MHRSGTSALSGVLSILGCDAPRTPMPSSEANEKGFFEYVAIYELHKDLLESAGSSWMDWHPFYDGWFGTSRAEEFQQRASDILDKEFGKSRFFVLKDPRMCRLMPFWLDTLQEMEITPLILHTHRNPLDVVASLTRHHNLSRELGLLLWLRHVLDAERDTRGMTRHFTSYNRFLGNWGREVKRLQKGLSMTLPRQSTRAQAEVGNFLQGSLRHFDTAPESLEDNPAVSEWISSAFSILERWAEQGEDAADHAELDRITRDLDQAGPVFAELVSSGETSRKKLKLSETATNEMRATLGKLEEQLESAKADAATTEAKAKSLAGRESEALARLEAAEARITQMETRLDAETSASRQAALDLEASEVTVSRLTEELALTNSTLQQRTAELEQSHRSQSEADQQLARLHSEHAEALARLTGKVTEQETEIARLQEDHKARIDVLSSQLSDRMMALSHSDAKAAELEETVAARFRELAALTRMVQENEERSASERLALSQTLDTERRRAAEALTAERQLYETRLATEKKTMARKLETETHRRETAEFTNMAIKDSTSWRFTAPLRKISSLLRPDKYER